MGRGRVPRLRAAGAYAKEKFRNTQIAYCTHPYENGINESEFVNWE
jgi:xylulose-5-phosphate/fructose-6-phosphate phosphoketolase